MSYTKEQLAFIRQVNSGSGGATSEVKEKSREWKSKKRQGEDLTIDGYIKKHGGIESPCDEKVYTTKASYEDHLKANDRVIKDWA